MVDKDRLLLHFPFRRQAKITRSQDLFVRREAPTKSLPDRIRVTASKKRFTGQLGVGGQGSQQRRLLLDGKTLHQERSNDLSPGVVAHTIEQPHKQPPASVLRPTRQRPEEMDCRARMLQVSLYISADQRTSPGIQCLQSCQQPLL